MHTYKVVLVMKLFKLNIST